MGDRRGAAFGLARQLADHGNKKAAIAALDEVPTSSRHYNVARMSSALTMLSGVPIAELDESTLREAARRVRALPAEESRSLHTANSQAHSSKGTQSREQGKPCSDAPTACRHTVSG
ncbi:tetratricopeptide repeat protein, partial [Streptomyces sp. NPDC002130]|uniref:tetratricopeptide repeat protein n=1 Tax=Streptomyces sp. NPDC002130 TaxID=3155568 RepID=UPI003316F686